MKEFVSFQGENNIAPYFEGWYYKQVNAEENTGISFIPGMARNRKDPHCFVQAILQRKNHNGVPVTKTAYFRFPIDKFRWRQEPFGVEIDGNLFTKEGCSVSLSNETMRIEGMFQFGSFTTMPTTKYMPTIMGPFQYLGFLECYHALVSMNHSLSGSVQVDGMTVSFDGGKGYIEKDWGSSFPKRYVWLQCNHFTNPNTALFFSDADIPFKMFSFQGHICYLVLDGKEYRFATYTGSKATVTHPSDHEIIASVENRTYQLIIEASFINQGNLIAPVPNGMEKEIKEGIAGTITFTIRNKKTNEVFSDTGQMAGIEVVS